MRPKNNVQMKVLAIIQARLGSKRFPNKVLAQIPPESGVSMLEMVVRKACLATTVDDVVVVTPDKQIATMCGRWNIRAYMPSWNERDVVREFYEAARAEKADAIVRLTADCPLLQPQEIDRVVREYKAGNYDIVCNTDESTGQLNGEGSDVECFSSFALHLANVFAIRDMREHVTTWMRKYLITYKMTPSPVLGIKSINTLEDYKWVCSYFNTTSEG
ncbi:MAG TPA: NTP transferase domain-containing protein [Planctomycetes bacterium]|nr:NTP transferase domain-containing protein [Planctomycetota bacterium]